MFLDFFSKPILGKGSMPTIVHWILKKSDFLSTINLTSVNLVPFDGHRHLKKTGKTALFPGRQGQSLGFYQNNYVQLVVPQL